jgi:hypothetical protein
VAAISGPTISGALAPWRSSGPPDRRDNRNISRMSGSRAAPASAGSPSAGRVASTSSSDPLVLFGTPLLLAILALFACFIAARRSMQIDSIVALRQE